MGNGSFSGNPKTEWLFPAARPGKPDLVATIPDLWEASSDPGRLGAATSSVPP